VLSDTAFHAKAGDPANLKLCGRGRWNTRMLVETVLSNDNWRLSSEESRPSDVGGLPNAACLYGGHL